MCRGAASCALPTRISRIPVFDAVVCTWTIPTPIAKKNKDNHFVEESVFRRRTTENAAVVRIFI
jgi:hypothetical protein